MDPDYKHTELKPNQVHIDMCAYNKYKQIISNVFKNSSLLQKRIIIWETTPQLVKAARKRILRSRASNQQEEDSKCVSGGEKHWWKDELWGVCVCWCVYNSRAEKCDCSEDIDQSTSS